MNLIIISLIIKYFKIKNKIIYQKKYVTFKNYNEVDKSLKLYYDNFLLMIDEYKVFNKDIKKELFIIFPYIQ